MKTVMEEADDHGLKIIVSLVEGRGIEQDNRRKEWISREGTVVKGLDGEDKKH